jgi:hypothetical protein
MVITEVLMSENLIQLGNAVDEISTDRDNKEARKGLYLTKKHRYVTDIAVNDPICPNRQF